MRNSRLYWRASCQPRCSVQSHIPIRYLMSIRSSGASRGILTRFFLGWFPSQSKLVVSSIKPNPSEPERTVRISLITNHQQSRIKPTSIHPPHFQFAINPRSRLNPRVDSFISSFFPSFLPSFPPCPSVLFGSHLSVHPSIPVANPTQPLKYPSSTLPIPFIYSTTPNPKPQTEGKHHNRHP
jgi:hypothetical protein